MSQFLFKIKIIIWPDHKKRVVSSLHIFQSDKLPDMICTDDVYHTYNPGSYTSALSAPPNFPGKLITISWFNISFKVNFRYRFYFQYCYIGTTYMFFPYTNLRLFNTHDEKISTLIFWYLLSRFVSRMKKPFIADVNVSSQKYKYFWKKAGLFVGSESQNR